MENKNLPIYFSTYDDIKNPHYGGGGAIAVHEVAKRLSKKYDIRVVSWDYNGKKKETIDGVKYERFGMPMLSPKIAMFAYQLGLPFIAAKKTYTLWFESFCPPFTTSFLPEFTKKTVVGIVHMLAAEDMERKYKLPFHLVQNSGIKKYNHIITTSEMIKKKIEKIYPKISPIIISNGVTAVYKPLLNKKKYILFLGRIEVDQKGIDLLIGSFRQFHSQKNDYQLIIAGDGDPKEIAKVEYLIKSLNLKESIVMKGKVTGKTKETLLKNAACVVVPSRFETYSLVALEAMSHGTPLVCFAIDGLSWIPKNVVKKVNPFAVESLAKTLMSIVSDKEATQKMVKEANAYAKQFTWDAITKKYIEYISSLL